MSDSSDERSTESEDGEIERESKHKKSRRDRGHSYTAESYHYKRKRIRKKLTPSPELQLVSDDNNSAIVEEEDEDEEEEEVEIEDEDISDEANEESLDIKPPQAQSSKTYSSNSNYYRNRNERSTDKESNRSTNDSPFKQKDRYRERHRHRYGDNKSVRSDEELRKRRRDDINEYNSKKLRINDKEKSGERWMTLDDRNTRNKDTESMDNWKNKNSDQTVSRSQRDRYNKEIRERSLKTSPKTQKNISKTVTSSPNSSLSSLQSTQKSKNPSKKLSSLIEVQEVELSEEEFLSEEHKSVGTDSSRNSDKNSEKSVNSESDDNNENINDNEKHELSDNAKENSDHELRNPRIVIDHDVLYFQESNPVDKNVYKSSDTLTDIEPMSDETKDELPPYYPAIQGCRSVEEFQCINRIEEGTYGVVYRARDKRTNETVALKRLKMEKEKEGFPITSLREISTLLKAQHQNIVTVREIVVGSNMDKIYIVMEFVEHDLKSLMETMKQPFLLGEVKTLMMQLLRAVAHLHDNWILHRDLKTSNLLLSHKGILKVGDFGLAREYGSPLKAYTPIVVTLWYRSPELLLQAKQYSYPIDIWSVGCIFGELLTMKPLFPGKSEIDQLNIIFKDLGTPNEKIWPGYSELPLVKKVTFTEHPYNNLHNRFGQKLTKLGFDLLNRFLTYCPNRRITAEEALKHEFFKESPLPVDPSMFPTWPAKSELGVGVHSRKAQSPKPPSGGKQFAKQLAGDDDEKLIVNSGKFHMNLAVQGRSSKGGGFNLKF